ncbi:MAG: M23 family metallopeptidase, partial [Saprospiraceae bacterium]|nr:M23 family metallopeptidase [Saprospiraceae bacterium]
MNYHRYAMWVVLLLSNIIAGFGNDSLRYASPVDHQIRLTGNFMEIRTNHFHSGIDIKSSDGKPGDVIRSVQDGYISRVKIQSGSYGNALYIDHPSTGHTSVYAHLHEFNEAIASFVENVQYNTESFEVDIYLPEGLMKVAQGQQIGTMGNTGRSFGPHLHFELRDTKTEEPINPEMLGLGPSDNRVPVIENLTVYALDDNQMVRDKSVKYFKQKGSQYKLYQDEIEVDEKYVAFGLHMHDYMDGSYNKNGVFGYKVFVDDVLEFQWKADRYNFEENRLLNGFIDYQRRKELGHKVYLLYRQGCNEFGGYNGKGNGIIEMSGSAPKKIRLEVYDLHNNTATLEFFVKSIVKKDGSPALSNVINCNEKHIITSEHFTVNLDSTDLFGSMVIESKESSQKIGSELFPAINIGENSISPKSYYRIKINGEDFSPEAKWTLVYSNNGKLQDFGLKYDTEQDQVY